MTRRARTNRRGIGALVVLVIASTGACGSGGTDELLASASTTSSTTAAAPTSAHETAAPSSQTAPSTTSPASEPTGADPVPEPDSSVGAALLVGYLDELVVADHDPARPDYDRDTWAEGLDADGDCLRTRHEVLAEESLTTVRIEDCRVAAGSWIDPLSGQAVDDPLLLEVDHLVALADAHRSGGWRWNEDRKAAFTNFLDDPDHLNALTSAENQRKSDEGPESYRPADPDAWCWYATAYARVKVTWELTVTPAQMQGLQDLVASCP